MRSMCVLTLSGADATNFQVMRSFAGIDGKFANREEGDAEFLRMLLENFAGDLLTYRELTGRDFDSPDDLAVLRAHMRRLACESRGQPDRAISG